MVSTKLAADSRLPIVPVSSQANPRPNNVSFAAERALCGYFVIVSSEKMTAREAISLYKGRDSSEKLFSGDKSYLGNKSVRVYSDESVSAKIFVEFIALIIRSKIYTLLKDEMLRSDTKANFMTVPVALRELDKIEMVRSLDGNYRIDHAVTATQKAILDAFGIDIPHIKRKAALFNAQLSEKTEGGSYYGTHEKRRISG